MGCAASNSTSDQAGLLSKPQVFFLLGGPGSGKGTQAEYLIRDYKFKHLSTGDLLREEKEKGGEFAAQIDSFIKEGKLLPSSLVVSLLKKSMATYGNRRYLLDGFPRNRQNWEECKKQLSDLVVVRNMIFFDCPMETLVERITERGKSSGRTDDNPETAKKRLATFENETLPIVHDFEEMHNCLKVNANQSKDKVYAEVKEKLEHANVLPPNPANMLFVLGGPGSGKGTQCQILVKQYGFIHLSTGDLLREEVKTGSKLGKEIDAVIKDGKLVSSDLMVRLISEQVERRNYGGLYLLDGFPRGQQNMDVWEKQMSKWVNLKAVIYFQCEEGELKRRLLERGKTSGRSDDNAESIQKRLDVFNGQTKPVVEFYTIAKKLYSINAKRTIPQITKDVESLLDKLGIFPLKHKQEAKPEMKPEVKPKEQPKKDTKEKKEQSHQAGPAVNHVA